MEIFPQKRSQKEIISLHPIMHDAVWQQNKIHDQRTLLYQGVIVHVHTS
jgi:hypothetical protein